MIPNLHNQSGVALIASLVILLIITLFGLSSIDRKSVV